MEHLRSAVGYHAGGGKASVLLLDETNRALLSGAVLLLAWVSIEEAPLVADSNFDESE